MQEYFKNVPNQLNDSSDEIHDDLSKKPNNGSHGSSAFKYDNLKGVMVHGGAEMTDTHVYFWGSIYSQWCFSEFVIGDQTFVNTEQWMMYQKAITFRDFDSARRILATDNPQEMKAIGRRVKNFNADKWADVSFDFVVQGNYAKFKQNPAMLKCLLETEDRQIVEASPYDKIWGIGIGMHDERKYDKTQWDGDNLLGKAIMKVREQIKADLEYVNNW